MSKAEHVHPIGGGGGSGGEPTRSKADGAQ
jgi:hypothetical protein